MKTLLPILVILVSLTFAPLCFSAEEAVTDCSEQFAFADQQDRPSEHLSPECYLQLMTTNFHGVISAFQDIYDGIKAQLLEAGDLEGVEDIGKCFDLVEKQSLRSASIAKDLEVAIASGDYDEAEFWDQFRVFLSKASDVRDYTAQLYCKGGCSDGVYGYCREGMTIGQCQKMMSDCSLFDKQEL